MAETKLSNNQKKEWAKHLFLTETDMTQKQIAAKVEVSEKTMSGWVNEGKWDAMRKSLMTTRDEILRDLYEVLVGMKNEAKIAATDNDPNTKPDTDGIYKQILAIRKFEIETGAGPMIATLKQFIIFLQKIDFGLAQQLTPLADAFIKDRLKNS